MNMYIIFRNSLCKYFTWRAGWPNGLRSCNGNGNSHNVSRSKLRLHCHQRPLERALYKWLTKSAAMPMSYINEVHKNSATNRIFQSKHCKLGLLNNEHSENE